MLRRGSEQGGQRTVPGGDHLSAKLQHAAEFRVFFDHLDALPGIDEFPVLKFRHGNEGLQSLEALPGRLEHLTDEVLGERDILSTGGQHGNHVVRPEGQWHVEDRAMAQILC